MIPMARRKNAAENKAHATMLLRCKGSSGQVGISEEVGAKREVCLGKYKGLGYETCLSGEHTT